MTQNGPDEPESPDAEDKSKKTEQGLAGFTAVLKASVQAHEAQLTAIDDNASTQVLDADDQNVTEEARGTELLFRANTPQNRQEDRELATPMLSDKNYAVYHELFADSSYSALARLIQTRNNEISSSMINGQTHFFIKRLQNINPALEFAVRGASQALNEALKSSDKTAIEEARATLENFKKIQEMYLCLEALANNKSRYSKDYYDSKIQSILSSIPSDEQETLFDAIDESVGKDLSSKRRFYQIGSSGSTEFDAKADKLDIEKYHKRVKIQHEYIEVGGSKNLMVKAQFSYNRSHLLDSTSGKKYWRNPAKEHKALIEQTADFVTVALHEYKVGTASRPINIKYYGAEGVNLSEAAFAVLMEYKKRAMANGTSFYAKNETGQTIEITPSSSFNNDEKAYFLSFATQTPQAHTRTGLKAGKFSAGVSFLNQEMGNKIEPESVDPVIIATTMENYLTNWHLQHNDKMNNKMDKVAHQLSEKRDIAPGPSK